VGVGAGGDLRAVGDHQHLGGLGQAAQAQAHRVGHGAADPWSTSSKIISGWRARPARPARAAFRARAKRASSPPEAMAPRSPNGAPGLVAISKATRSSRTGRRALRTSGSTATRKRALSSFSGASSPRRRRPDALAGRRGAPRSGWRRRPGSGAGRGLLRLGGAQPSPEVSMAASRAAKSARRSGRASTVVDSLRARARRANSRSSAFSSRSGSTSKLSAAVSMAAAASWASTRVRSTASPAAVRRAMAGPRRAARPAGPARAPAPGPGRPGQLGGQAVAGEGVAGGGEVGQGLLGGAEQGALLGQLHLLALARVEAVEFAQPQGQLLGLGRRAAGQVAQGGLLARRPPGAPGAATRPSDTAPKASSSGRWVRRRAGRRSRAGRAPRAAAAPISFSAADAGGLVVDEGAAAAVGAEGAAQHQVLVAAVVEALVVEQGPDGMVAVEGEAGDGGGLGAPGAPARRRRARRSPGPGRRG
jgi:hypothetical protein